MVQVGGQFGVRVGLPLVAGPALVEQFPAGVSELAKIGPSDSRLAMMSGWSDGTVRSCSAVSRWWRAASRSSSGTTLMRSAMVALLSGRPAVAAGRVGVGRSGLVGGVLLPGSGGCSHPRKLGPVTLAMGWILPLKRALPLPRRERVAVGEHADVAGDQPGRVQRCATAEPGAGMVMPCWP